MRTFSVYSVYMVLYSVLFTILNCMEHEITSPRAIVTSPQVVVPVSPQGTRKDLPKRSLSPTFKLDLARLLTVKSQDTGCSDVASLISQFESQAVEAEVQTPRTAAVTTFSELIAKYDQRENKFEYYAEVLDTFRKNIQSFQTSPREGQLDKLQELNSAFKVIIFNKFLAINKKVGAVFAGQSIPSVELLQQHIVLLQEQAQAGVLLNSIKELNKTLKTMGGKSGTRRAITPRGVHSPRPGDSPRKQLSRFNPQSKNQ